MQRMRNASRGPVQKAAEGASCPQRPQVLPAARNPCAGPRIGAPAAPSLVRGTTLASRTHAAQRNASRDPAQETAEGASLPNALRLCPLRGTLALDPGSALRLAPSVVRGTRAGERRGDKARRPCNLVPSSPGASGRSTVGPGRMIAQRTSGGVDRPDEPGDDDSGGRAFRFSRKATADAKATALRLRRRLSGERRIPSPAGIL